MGKLTSKKRLLFLIIILAFLLRVIKVGSLPPLYTDEASFGYNAYSILKTGRDEYGEFLPVILRSFGDYTRQEVFTYDTLPYETYDEWGEAWKIFDTNVNVAGFPLDLASDYNGQTFELHSGFTDAGTPFTRTLVIGTNFNALNFFKRVNNGVELWFNREASGSVVNIFIKEDNEASWQSVGSASIADPGLPETVNVHVPFDKRAKFLKIRMQSTDYFEFLGAIFTEYELDDYR